MSVLKMFRFDWLNISPITQASYVCGHCGNRVGPHHGYTASNKNYLSQNTSLLEQTLHIYICPACYRPTFFDSDKKQYPGVRKGNDISGVTDDQLYALYNEARDCSGMGAHTATVMLCRKMLMHVAVDKGAKAGESFAAYIQFLQDSGYIPPNGKEWADSIRRKGNEQNHQISIAEENEATQLLGFVEMLLRFSYEFPAMVKAT